jgi:hypothetical protein
MPTGLAELNKVRARQRFNRLVWVRLGPNHRTSVWRQQHGKPGRLAEDSSIPCRIPSRPCKCDLQARPRPAPLMQVRGMRSGSSELHQPRSSGYRERAHGIVGSMKGRGVLESKYSGRLIATFDPLLCLILEVKVLLKHSVA